MAQSSQPGSVLQQAQGPDPGRSVERFGLDSELAHFSAPSYEQEAPGAGPEVTAAKKNPPCPPDILQLSLQKEPSPAEASPNLGTPGRCHQDRGQEGAWTGQQGGCRAAGVSSPLQSLAPARGGPCHSRGIPTFQTRPGTPARLQHPKVPAQIQSYHLEKPKSLSSDAPTPPLLSKGHHASTAGSTAHPGLGQILLSATPCFSWLGNAAFSSQFAIPTFEHHNPRECGWVTSSLQLPQRVLLQGWSIIPIPQSPELQGQPCTGQGAAAAFHKKRKRKGLAGRSHAINKSDSCSAPGQPKCLGCYKSRTSGPANISSEVSKPKAFPCRQVELPVNNRPDSFGEPQPGPRWL